MIRVHSLAASLALLATAYGAAAQADAPPPAPPAAPAGQDAPPPADDGMQFAMPAFPKVDMNGATFTDADKTAEAIDAGTKALEKAAATYKSAPGITDTVTLTMKSPMGDQTDSMKVVLGAGSDASITVGGGQLAIVAADGQVNVASSMFGDRYVRVPMKDGLARSLEAGLPELGLPLPHLRLRDGADGARVVRVFNVAGIEVNRVAGCREREGVQEVLLAGVEGTDILVVTEPATGLIRRLRYVTTPPDAPEGFRLSMSLDMEPAIVDPAPAVAFDPEGRTAVSSLMEAMSNVIKVGAMAPDFTLKDQTGAETTLSGLKGSVVVLDFWATWCLPCRKGLPKLNDFAKWVDETKQNVKVFGMNVFERGDPSKAMEKVSEYWTTEGFGFPTLMGNEDVARAFGCESIPLTVVIGPDGTVAAVHQGFDPAMADTLKSDVQKALGASKG